MRATITLLSFLQLLLLPVSASEPVPINVTVPPPDFDEPPRSGSRTSTDNRGDCPNISESVPTKLTALIPASNIGRTTLEQPTLWFYIPYTSEDVAYGEFVLQNSAGEDLDGERVRFLVANEPGFMSLTLPQQYALGNTGEAYHWFLELYCTPEGSPVYVEGWIERISVTAELENLLQESEFSLDEAYATTGVWFDAIDALAAARAELPAEPLLLERWDRLLTAPGVDLDAIPSHKFTGSFIID